MNDMSQAIIPKSDQINADDLIAGPMTITITGVTVIGGQEQPVAIQFAESGKVYRPCKSMSRVLVAAWGPDANAYAGRSLTLYRDPKVKWGGMEVGGIRISHMTNIDRELTLMLTMTKQNRAPHKVKVLERSAPAVPVINPDHQEAAKTAAAQGTEAFKAWWAGNADMRPSAKPIMDALKATCATADAAKVSDTPPDTPDDEELPM
jgi:hypothetical protein